jgi:hypothetical protein
LEKDLQITKLIAPYLLPNAALKQDRRDLARPLALRQFEKSILEKHTLFPCWIQGLAIAPHQKSARASLKLIPPKEEKKTAVEQLANSTYNI